MTPRQQARLGGFHIEEAILETLFHADAEYTRLQVYHGNWVSLLGMKAPG